MGNEQVFNCKCQHCPLKDCAFHEPETTTTNTHIHGIKNVVPYINDVHYLNPTSYISKLKAQLTTKSSYHNNNNNYVNTSSINASLYNYTTTLNEHHKLITTIQRVYRGYSYRIKFTTTIKPALLIHHDQMLMQIQTSFTLNIPTIDYNNNSNNNFIHILCKDKFNPKGWTMYYPDTMCYLFEHSLTFKHGILLPCALHIYNGNTSYYIGKVNINNKRCGYGTLYDISGNIYEGTWDNDMLCGWCRVTENNVALSEGYYINNKLNGKGERYYSDGTVYVGDFVNNQRHGEGKEENGDHCYVGHFAFDKKHGKGMLRYKHKGDYYIGEFKDNNINGKGKYTWENKDAYEGMFENGKMHGKGRYMWLDGDVYEGEYVNGMKEGYGVFKWKKDGKVYEGRFEKGKPHGKGRFYVEEKEYDVEFDNGKMIQSKSIRS